MKVFALLLLIPNLITADILCPNIKTTCSEDTRCCEVDGEYSCCVSDDDLEVPDIRTKVYPGVEMRSPNAFGNFSFSGNETIQQYDSCLDCTGTCCNGGCCADYLATCCGDGCCPSLGKCCGDGCCNSFETCCTDGSCCPSGYSTCCGSWCCKTGYRCGSRHKSCISKGSTVYPEIAVLLLLAASVFVSRHL